MRLRPTGSDADGRLATEPDGGAATQPPPPGGFERDPEQRRFDLKMIGLMLVLVALLVGALFVYLHFHDQAVARARARSDAAARAAAAQAEAAQKVAEVKQAYLDYDAALSRMEQQGSMAPLQSYLTAAGMQDELSTFQAISASGFHYLLESQHQIQVSVYSGDRLASVDDVLLQRTTPLDPTTMAPVGKTTVLPVHSSVALKREGGDWLVDSSVTFGADGSDPRLGLSYAATNRDKPLDPGLSHQIQKDFETYLTARTEAYENLDPAPLRSTILSPALEVDLSLLNRHLQEHRGLAFRAEHNYRFALKDAQTAFVYDTIADSSYAFDFSTKQPVSTPPTTIIRETFELKRVGAQWKVDDVALNTSR